MADVIEFEATRQPPQPAPTQIWDIIGPAALAHIAFSGKSLQPIADNLVDRVAKNYLDYGAWLDLSFVEQLRGNRTVGLRLQAAALARCRLYRRPSDCGSTDIRVLVLLAPGDFMMNTPIDFLLDSQRVERWFFYATDKADPFDLSLIDEFDCVFVAIAENDANAPVLDRLSHILGDWAINPPSNIRRLTRDGAWALLHETAGIVYPNNRRITRDRLLECALAPKAPPDSPLAEGFPIIVRPVGSHAGAGLAKIEHATDLVAALAAAPSDEYYTATFIDYRSPDGLYRKYRIAVVDGVAFPVHLAISSHWMIHYLNADMIGNSVNQAEEQQFITDFSSDFGMRHAAAIKSIADKVGLHYFQLDCSETADGRLLIFEIGTAMIVHSMDPPDIFPYKSAAMAAIFDAFVEMLHRRMRPLGRQSSRKAADAVRG